MTQRTIFDLRRSVAIGAALVAATICAAAGAAPASAAYSFGPLTLSGGGAKEVVVPGMSIRSVSFGVTSGSASKGAGWGGGGDTPKTFSSLSITKLADETSTTLLSAVAAGKHYAKGSVTLTNSKGVEAYCLADVFVTSVQQLGRSGAEIVSQETLQLSYAKVKIESGACGEETPPPAFSTLLGSTRHGSAILARVDCLIARCGGILTVSLPTAACHGGPSLCSFTGGVRVGLDGGGKVHFNGDGTATLNGGTRVGLGGDGRFSMGDGSVKVLSLSVPQALQKWLSGHRHALLGAIIVVRGTKTALFSRERLDAPPNLPLGIQTESLEPTPAAGGAPPPADVEQSVSVASCDTPPVGVPPAGAPVVVSGSLTPARAGAQVTLTYTPTSGPLPLPAAVVDVVPTDATGAFSESFEREREGKPYAWNVVADVPEGAGYAAAHSASCAIPIP